MNANEKAIFWKSFAVLLIVFGIAFLYRGIYGEGMNLFTLVVVVLLTWAAIDVEVEP